MPRHRSLFGITASLTLGLVVASDESFSGELSIWDEAVLDTLLVQRVVKSGSLNKWVEKRTVRPRGAA